MTEIPADDTLEATENLMRFRLRSGSFAAGQGGAQLEHFTETTQPSMSAARAVTTRQAAQIVRDYPTAVAADLSDLVTIAALRSAIELETAAQNMDPERIRSWRDTLKDEIAGLTGRLGGSGATDGGDAGLDAKWDFGERDCSHTPGSELAYGTKNGPLQW